MKKNQKSNRVDKGSVTVVQPIRKKKDIEAIKKIFINLIIIFLFLLVVLVIILSTTGITTDRFNKLISYKVDG